MKKCFFDVIWWFSLTFLNEEAILCFFLANTQTEMAFSSTKFTPPHTQSHTHNKHAYGVSFSLSYTKSSDENWVFHF